MKNLFTASILFAALPLFAATPSPVGDWVTYTEKDPTVKEGLVHIYQTKAEDGTVVFKGKIGKSLLEKKDPDAPTVCVNCPEPFTGKEIQGLEFLWGFVPDEDQSNKFVDGHVLDPLTGNVYNANMTLSEDGNTLVFRGYMGISLFGSDRTWTRYVEPAKPNKGKKKSAKKKA